MLKNRVAPIWLKGFHQGLCDDSNFSSVNKTWQVAIAIGNSRGGGQLMRDVINELLHVKPNSGTNDTPTDLN